MNQPMKKSGKRNKGFYIALGVCLIAVGVAAWTTYSSVSNNTLPKTSVQSQGENKKANHIVSGVPVKNPPSSAARKPSSSAKPLPSRPASPTPAEKTSKQTATKPVSFILPVRGSVIQNFSKKPVFSKTFGDYRAHPGVDLKAQAGESVKSVADGTVQKVFKSDQYGNTVIVKYGSLETWYCGLNHMAVKENHSVQQGQEIGTVGTDPSENAESPHLHLMMERNGQYLDPMSVLK